MRQYSDQELDEMIKYTIREMLESITPPPLEESWAKLEKKLKEQQLPTAARKNVFRLAIAVGMSVLLVGTFCLAFPIKAKAIGAKIVQTVESLLSGTQINVRTGYGHGQAARTPPPPEDIPLEKEQIVSLEEARSASPFPLATPQYIPEGFKLAEVKFRQLVKDTAKVSLKYTAPNGNYFSISEKNAPEGYIQGYGYDLEDAAGEDLTIGDSPAKLFIYKDKTIEIRWFKQGIVYEMTGKIKQEEAIKIAASVHQ